MNMRFTLPDEFIPPYATRLAGNRWMKQLFAAKAIKKGGIIRRSLADVDRQVGRSILLEEVERRRFHAVICGDQFIILCNSGRLQVMT